MKYELVTSLIILAFTNMLAAAEEIGVKPPLKNMKSREFPGKGKKIPESVSPINNIAINGKDNVDVSYLEWLIQKRFIRKFSNLVKSATISRAPWPASYWPVYLDGINHRWAGSTERSPSEKYAVAFGLNATLVQDMISSENGVDSQYYATSCVNKSSCKTGEECSFRRGDTTNGKCIATWFGVCHAWAPAAILHPEPLCPVKVKNVVFQPVDIKALITQIYDKAYVSTVFTGKRCDLAKDTVLDNYGRFAAQECADISPAFFHIAAYNMLANGHSFIVDVTSTAEVWNQPVLGVWLVAEETITLEKAMSDYFPGQKNSAQLFNGSTSNMKLVTSSFDYIVENFENTVNVTASYTRRKYYSYILQLDSQGEIIGGEWVGGSRKDHIDFLWSPVSQAPDNTVVDGGLSYTHIKNMVDISAIGGSCKNRTYIPRQ